MLDPHVEPAEQLSEQDLNDEINLSHFLPWTNRILIKDRMLFS